MRQILVLGLLAALGWWLYDAYIAEPALAVTPQGNVSTATDGGAERPSTPLADLLGSGAARPDTVPVASGAVTTGAATDGNAAGAALDAAGQQALAELVAGIERLEVAAIDQAWVAVASGKLAAGPQRQLLDALTNDGEFDALLVRLGSYNTFLHLADGRAFADKVFAAAMALPDAEAVPAGTGFLNLCLRGRIEKADVTARGLIDRAYATYRQRADRWLCDSENVSGARSYTVVAGDSLNRIARKFRRDEKLLVDEGTIAVLNRIHNKNSIRPGQRLKIPVEPLRSVVEKRSFSLAVYVGDDLLRLYWVGHGRNDKTPVTVFTIGDKQPKPQWTAPDGNVWPYGHPNNILGEYWIEFRNDYKPGFGAHGTPMPDTIGTMSSDGCIRMHAPDIAELFEILPRGCTVEVRASQAAS